jgi:hypothetical protein
MLRPVSIIALVFLALGVTVCVWASGPLEDAYRLMAHGEYDQALTKLDAALAELPSDPSQATAEQKERQAETLFLVGRAREQLGDLDGALGAYGIVTGSFKDSACYANACLSLAQLHIRRNEPDKAAAELDKALASGLSPDHEFRANLLLAEALSIPGTRVQDLDRAIEIYGKLDEKAHEQADLARINYGLGFCYQQKDDWKRAEEFYVTVAQTAPDSPWAFYAKMQRIAYYRNQQLDQDAALLLSQIRQQRVELKGLVDAGPLAPNLFEAAPVDLKIGQGPVREIRLPEHSVFAHKSYTIRAGQFLMRQPGQTLIGRTNVVLQRRGPKSGRMQVRAAMVTIDLRHLNASFSGNVVVETLPTEPGAEPQKVGSFAGLVINLDTSWLHFRFTEPTR